MDPITIGSVILTDFSNAVTDMLIAIISFAGWVSLRKIFFRRERYERLYLWFFLLMGWSTLFGSLFNHCFAYYLSSPYYLLPNYLFNLASLTCYGWAVTERYYRLRPGRGKTLLLAALGVVSLVMLVFLLWKVEYLYMVIHIGLVLVLFSLPLQLRLLPRKEARLIILATVVLLGVPPILITGWGFAPWLNDYDLAHLLIATAMVILYFAGRAWAQSDARK
jgi:hypothetical protein